MSKRRRALLLGGLALVLGGLAASNVAGREAALQRRVGPLVDVVVARTPIRSGSPIRPAALAVRRVPERFAPRDRVDAPSSLSGWRAAVDIPPGTDLTPAMVAERRLNVGMPEVRRGERVAEIVALGSPQLVVAGGRVDVLVTTEPVADDGGRALLALEDIKVIAVAPATGEPELAKGSRPAPGTRISASLLVTLRQAVYLAAAQDFAREIRLLPRARGDHRRAPPGLRMGAG